MRGLGFSEEQIAAIPHWQVADCFSPVERAVLAYTDAMTVDIDVGQAVHDALARYLNDREIVELTVLAASYNMHARVIRALQIEPEDD